MALSCVLVCYLFMRVPLMGCFGHLVKIFNFEILVLAFRSFLWCIGGCNELVVDDDDDIYI